jgi:hypothetical protein
VGSDLRQGLRIRDDELGLRAGMNYFVTHYDQPEILYRSPLTGEVLSGLHERMVRGAYFAFIRKHPWFVIEAHFAKTNGFLKC